MKIEDIVVISHKWFKDNNKERYKSLTILKEYKKQDCQDIKKNYLNLSKVIPNIKETKL